MKKSKIIPAILGIATTIMSILLPHTALATSKTANINVHVPESLALTLNSNALNFDIENEELHTDSLIITAKTNAAEGYAVSFNVNNNYNDLKHSNIYVEDKIPSIIKNETIYTFPETAWAYSLDTENYIFRQIPLTAKKVLTTTEKGENEHDFTIGVRAKADMAAGDYANELIFTIIANPNPNLGPKPLAILGENGNLNFVYDDNEYTIGQNYQDNLGTTAIQEIYNVPTDSCYVGWSNPNCVSPDWVNSASLIQSVNFTENFYNFRPTSTAGWFYGSKNLSNITNAQYLNTSNVVDMSNMFSDAGYNATTLTLDLNKWDTSNVTDMSHMFYATGYNATTLTLNINEWDTSNVIDMSYMFEATGRTATDFALNLSNWNTGNVQNMSDMFSYAGTNMLNLANWNTGNVTNMSYMFYYTSYESTTFILKLNNWDTSNVTNMRYMFGYAGYNATTWSIEGLSDWNTRNVTTMHSMFNSTGYSTDIIDIDVSGWDIHNVTDMSYMFNQFGYSATTWSIGDLSNWDTHNAAEIHCMFYNAGYNADVFVLNVSNWDTSKITNMADVFTGTGRNSAVWNITGLNTWDTSNVTDMSRMFLYAGEYATTFTLDLSTWKTSNVTNMAYMFDCTGCEVDTFILDLSNWDTSNVTTMYSMFTSAGYNADTFILDLSNWNTSNVTDMGCMFLWAGYNASTWSIGNLSNWNVSKVTDHGGFSDGRRTFAEPHWI